jgi:succinylglutamic semialdehyde dehydrogenase
VIRAEDFDQAIAKANARRYGLAVGRIGGTPQDDSRFSANVRAGRVSWNRAMTAESPGALGGWDFRGNTIRALDMRQTGVAIRYPCRN